MKKTLAIILTLALVICMMPASAFAAMVTNTISGSNGQYTATYENELTYNAKPQAPPITLSGEQAPQNPTYIYKTSNNGQVEGAPTEAGEYKIFIDEQAIGEFTISKVSIGSTEITTKPNVNIDATVKTTIAGIPQYNMDTTLKN